MGKILDFLFGKSPKIFDKEGNVIHQHPQSKWDNWNQRYMASSEYNWRNHSGTKAKKDSSSRPNTQN